MCLQLYSYSRQSIYVCTVQTQKDRQTVSLDYRNPYIPVLSTAVQVRVPYKYLYCTGTYEYRTEYGRTSSVRVVYTLRTNLYHQIISLGIFLCVHSSAFRQSTNRQTSYKLYQNVQYKYGLPMWGLVCNSYVICTRYKCNSLFHTFSGTIKVWDTLGHHFFPRALFFCSKKGSTLFLYKWVCFTKNETLVQDRVFTNNSNSKYRVIYQPNY